MSFGELSIRFREERRSLLAPAAPALDPLFFAWVVFACFVDALPSAGEAIALSLDSTFESTVDSALLDRRARRDERRVVGLSALALRLLRREARAVALAALSFAELSSCLEGLSCSSPLSTPLGEPALDEAGLDEAGLDEAGLDEAGLDEAGLDDFERG